jgi:cytochrome P450
MLEFLRLLVRLRWPLYLASPLFGRFNPYRSEYAADPYPTYRRLREEAPFYLHPIFRVWVVSRYDDVSAILKDPRVSVQRASGNLPRFMNPFSGLSESFSAAIRGALLMVDPPDHTRLRNLVNKAFTPRVVEGLRPRIREVVDGVLDSLGQRATIDLVRDFATPVPVIVIAEMLGVPSADREAFKRWSTVIAGLLDPIGSEYGLREVEAAFEEMSRYFDALFEARRREPRNDLVSRLVAIEDEGDRLSSSELLATVALILGAGHETTTNLISNAVVALLRNPGERKRFQEDPGLASTAVDEFLRYDSPVQATDRLLREDVEYGGQVLRKGQFALLLLGSANRDPAQFPDPDRLDLGRRENRHLSFSQGVHFCLGAQLARAEAEIALQVLLQRFPDLRGDPDPPAWRRSLVLRGPAALPVSL